MTYIGHKLVDNVYIFQYSLCRLHLLLYVPDKIKDMDSHVLTHNAKTLEVINICEHVACRCNIVFSYGSPSQHKKIHAVTTMLTYPWKCTVLHCNHLGNTWKPLVLMTRHFDYCPSASEGDNQSVRSSAPVVSRCFPGGYNVKLYISRGRLAWWLQAFFAQCLCYDSGLLTLK